MSVKLDQIKHNALSAKILHTRNKWKYEAINNAILALTVIVPTLFLFALYVAKGTNYEDLINVISVILSVLLIAVSISSLIWKVTDNIIIHKLGMKNNIYIANECDQLANANENELNWFYKYVSEMDTQDSNALTELPDKERQEIYREALKQLTPGNYDVVCPNCKSSPWRFIKGDCQICGNSFAKPS